MSLDFVNGHSAAVRTQHIKRVDAPTAKDCHVTPRAVRNKFIAAHLLPALHSSVTSHEFTHWTYAYLWDASGVKKATVLAHV